MVRTVHGKEGRPRILATIGLAILCAVIGFSVACTYALSAQGGPKGPGFDDMDFFHHNASVLTTSFFGGGIGWVVGAVIGWLSTRAAIGPTRVQAWALRAAALLAVLVGLATLSFRSIFSFSVPMEILAFQTTILADAALASVTLVVLAQQGKLRQTGAVIGAIVAVAILVTAGTRFSSLVPLDRAWLNAWRSGQADAESFAPNLLNPAPRSCPGGFVDRGRPYSEGQEGGLDRWAPYSSSWLDGHVPRWLPDGFGLLADQSWSTRRVAWGVWADWDCREVRLTLDWGKPTSLRWRDFPASDQLGDWTVGVDAPGLCRGALAAESRCLEYRAWTGENQGGHGRLLVLQMLSIDRSEGDRIAMGIPVRG